MLKGTATRYEIKQGTYGLYGLGDLMDQTSRTEKMMFGSSDKSPLPEQSLLNIPCIYSVCWDANKQKYKAYFNSFGSAPQIPQRQAPPQQPRPQPQQRPQQAPQSTNISIERQCAAKSACGVAAARPEMTLGATIIWASTILSFIETGKGITTEVSDPEWPDSLPLGAPREPGEDEPPAADQPY